MLQSCKDDVNNYFVFSYVMMMMVMMEVMTANLAAVPLPCIIVAISVPRLGSLAPILAMHMILGRPNLVGSLRAMCSSLLHHGVPVQRGVTIRPVIPESLILVSVFDISGGGGKAYE